MADLVISNYNLSLTSILNILLSFQFLPLLPSSTILPPLKDLQFLEPLINAHYPSLPLCPHHTYYYLIFIYSLPNISAAISLSIIQILSTLLPGKTFTLWQLCDYTAQRNLAGKAHCHAY